MKYKSIDKKEFTSRKDVRKHLRSIGRGKNIKENYIPISQTSSDQDSISQIKDYKKKIKRFV